MNEGTRNFIFDAELATRIGVEEAIMYQNLAHWCAVNKANERNFFDGCYWTYNSIEAFCIIFPFWSQKQIRRILKSLEDSGYVKTGNYNSSPYDRTKWYSTIFPNGQMKESDRANEVDQKGETYNCSDINTDINTDNKQISSSILDSAESNENSEGMEPKTEDKQRGSEEGLRLAGGLLSCMKIHNPKLKEPSLESWAKEFDKIMRIDKRTFEEIKDMIIWCQKDQFWHRNILSPSKLRKQWDRLYLDQNSEWKRTKVADNFNFEFGI